ncbi:hypothetical protein [uncultured Shewanella sp.]|uniref:hypothetical protein n=1 Tax=uncultured Shewanella sp. TaxID=173975 RepID=UPI0026220F4B|nr:hypothetical protein [uncultured Shewanella sp.]
MRIRCSFIVEPEVHTHHQYAIDILRAWQKQEKEQESNKEVMIGRSNAFHQSLYLSGLYLHKLSPDLPQLVSELLPNDELSVEPLLWQLAQVGIKQKTQDAMLSQSQWQQFSSMLEKHGEEQTQALKTELASVSSSSEGGEGRNLHVQLDNITSLQLELLEKVNKLDAGASKTETINTNQVSQNLESIKSSQQDLIRRLNVISQQLTMPQQSVAIKSAEDDTLETQLKRARSVKAKGLW